MPSPSPVQIYTDGACSGNPGPGGWGAIVIDDGHEIELSDGEATTTNQRMELTAPIEGL
ncbi:MAG TPA: RNase H family protein, partial [Methylomirabilota bacterium]